QVLVEVCQKLLPRRVNAQPVADVAGAEPTLHRAGIAAAQAVHSQLLAETLLLRPLRLPLSTPALQITLKPLLEGFRRMRRNHLGVRPVEHPDLAPASFVKVDELLPFCRVHRSPPRSCQRTAAHTACGTCPYSGCCGARSDGAATTPRHAGHRPVGYRHVRPSAAPHRPTAEAAAPTGEGLEGCFP